MRIPNRGLPGGSVYVDAYKCLRVDAIASSMGAMDGRGTRRMTGPDRERLSPCVCSTLRMVSRAVTQLYDDILRPSGLRVTQFSILGAIARLGDANLRQLEHTLAIDQTTLTWSLNLLERGGGPVADSAEARRPGEDGSSRRGHAGPPAAERGPELDLRTHGRR